MKSKLLSVLASLAIAFGLWLYVITTVSPGSTETYYNIPVVLEGETLLTERGLMITSVSSSTVNIQLSGNRTDLSKVDSNTITVKADLTSIYGPGSRIPISYTTGFPGNVASNAFVIESKNPARIYATVERRVTRTVPVEVQWVGSAAEGFLADRENRVLEYDSLQITGPQSTVDTVEKAVISVDLREQRESISQSYVFTLCDAEGEPVNAELISVPVEEIRVDVRIQRVRDLRLNYLLIEGGGATAQNVEVELSVDTIRVSGSESALAALGEELVIGTINLSEVREDCSRIFVIPLEENISNLTGVTEVTAQIHLKDLEVRDFLITDIQAVNIPDGLAVELFTREQTIHVRGAAPKVQALSVDDITVTVDFTGAEVGLSTFRTLVHFAPGFEGLGTIQDESVSASVWMTEPEESTQAE